MCVLGAGVAKWLEYTCCAHAVIMDFQVQKSNMVTRKVFNLNLLLSSNKVLVSQGANSTGINDMEYKLHGPAQELIIWSINSTTPHRN